MVAFPISQLIFNNCGDIRKNININNNVFLSINYSYKKISQSIYMDSYNDKYLKYKAKYLNLKKTMSLINLSQAGGADKTEIYLFKAEWCGHCKGFKPVWEKIKEEYKDKYTFITLDSEKDKAKIDQWGVGGFPTIIKKTNNSAEEYVGPRDEGSVVEFIKKN